MKKLVFILILTSSTLFSCSKDDTNDNGSTNDPFSDLSNISGDEGSRIEVTQNAENLVFSGSNVLGWGGASLLNLNYSKNLRLLHDDFETLYLTFSVPSNLDFIEAAVGSHGLSGSTLQLIDTENLDSVIVEMYTTENQERNQFFGTLEIRRNVSYLNDVLDMVGSFEITRDGQIIKGLFWKKEVANW